MFKAASISAILLLLRLTYAISIPSSGVHNHTYSINKRLPSSTWYHAEDHPVRALFKRALNDGVTYPDIGSAAWSAPFPRSTPDSNALPAEWVAALNAAIAANKIPNVPSSSNRPQQNPVYPNGSNPNSPEICSATYKCRNADDIWDAPDGQFGLSFDDGPLPDTPKLLAFLDANNEKATHFMIGVNILANPQEFSASFDSDNDIAVHTWTHPYMTTLSNFEILGQLGWTMELIHRSTGGRIPKFWRPPYGDSDNRVRAIALEVFGLQTVIWNQDTSDWSIPTGGTTAAKVQDSMRQWLTGSKSPGLIILEHETSEASVDAFISAYPLIKSNGWKTTSLAQLFHGDAYQNAQSSNSNDVILGSILANDNPAVNSATNTTSAATSKTSSASSSSASSTSQSSSSMTSTVVVTSTAGNLAAGTSVTSSPSVTPNSATTVLSKEHSLGAILGAILALVVSI